MSALNPTDSSGVANGIKGIGYGLADFYAFVVKGYTDLAVQLPDNGASLGLTQAQQDEVALWRDHILTNLKAVFEGNAPASAVNMIPLISAQRPLGK